MTRQCKIKMCLSVIPQRFDSEVRILDHGVLASIIKQIEAILPDSMWLNDARFPTNRGWVARSYSLGDGHEFCETAIEVGERLINGLCGRDAFGFQNMSLFQVTHVRLNGRWCPLQDYLAERHLAKHRQSV